VTPVQDRNAVRLMTDSFPCDNYDDDDDDDDDKNIKGKRHHQSQL
jgi:hypothetical protein